MDALKISRARRRGGRRAVGWEGARERCRRRARARESENEVLGDGEIVAPNRIKGLAQVLLAVALPAKTNR